MTHPPLRFWLNGWLILFFLASCSARTPSRSAIQATPLAAPTQVVTASTSPTGTASVSLTAKPLEPTLTAITDIPTATPLPDNHSPQHERPAIDSHHVKQLQILAQWKTGLEESHYHWSPDSTRLLLISAPVIRMIDVQTFQQIWEAPGGDDALFSQDGSQVAIKNGTKTRVVRTADGQSNQSGPAFQAAPAVEMRQPEKGKPNEYQFPAVQEDGTHHVLRFPATNGCAAAVYTDLPAGITGYSFSPDRRLLLMIARGLDAQPHYQAVVYGINTGFESPLPAHFTGAEPPGFHPTRPSLGVTPLAPLRTPLPLGQREYPQPIDPPEDSPGDYRLRPLDEPSSLAMLQALAEYGWANDVYGPASGRGSLYNAQEALHTALLEYLARFPQSANLTAVQWQMALNNTILNRHDSDDWIASQIAGALNRKELAPALLSLNAGLAPFGYYADASFQPPLTPNANDCDPASALPSPLIVNNLLGDHRDSLVFMLRTVWSGVGVLFVLHQDTAGQYHVFPVGGQWDVYAGMGQTVQIMDLLGDGQPVIRLDYYWHNGSMNGSDTYFYRWRGTGSSGGTGSSEGQGIKEGRFIELTGGIDSGVDYEPIAFQFPNGPGTTKTIVAPKHGLNLFGQVQSLSWNGQRYVSSIRIPLPNDLSDDSKWLVAAAVANRQYGEVVTLIKSQPDDLSWRRFFLGYVEALQFHPGLARLALQPLADQASQNPGNTLAQAARAFLAAYSSGADLARACQAALKISQESGDQGAGDLGLYCNPALVTRSYLEWLSQQPPGDLPARLAGYGIQFSFQTSLDANDEGRPDWILAQKIPESSQDHITENPVWLILSEENGFQFFNLAFNRPISPGYPFGKVGYAGGALEWASLRLGGGADGKAVRILMLKEGPHALFLRLHQEGGIYAIDPLMLDEHVSEYQVAEQEVQGEQNGGSRQLVLFHNDPEDFSLPFSYHWNPATGALEYSDYLEHLLLIENNPTEALSIIPGLLDYVTTRYEQNSFERMMFTPRLKFFLGLAYELCGDKENAFHTYYNLWKAHPMNTKSDTSAGAEHYDQPYAIMARARLEKK